MTKGAIREPLHEENFTLPAFVWVVEAWFVASYVILKQNLEANHLTFVGLTRSPPHEATHGPVDGLLRLHLPHARLLATLVLTQWVLDHQTLVSFQTLLFVQGVERLKVIDRV